MPRLCRQLFLWSTVNRTDARPEGPTEPGMENLGAGDKPAVEAQGGKGYDGRILGPRMAVGEGNQRSRPRRRLSIYLPQDRYKPSIFNECVIEISTSPALVIFSRFSSPSFSLSPSASPARFLSLSPAFLSDAALPPAVGDGEQGTPASCSFRLRP
nr:unnamed protein product [Digitaria exilis]